MRRILLAMSLTLHDVSAEQAVMTWLIPDLPPISIRSNDKPGAGIIDKEIAYVAAHWPEVEHRFVYANLKRSWAMLKAGLPACYSFALINPERLKVAYIVETGMLPPLHLLARSEVAGALPLTRQEVDLPLLLSMHELHGLISEKRSFGKPLDNMLRQRPADASLTLTTINNYGETIFSMMLLKRVDYTIDYDFILSYYQSRNHKLAGVRSFPIANNVEPVKFGFACPKTAWGKATARKIDGILGTRDGAQAMRHSVEAWLSQDTRRRYADQFGVFYRRRETPMLPLDGP
ncbi:TIGR02285 family protein [Janthinobacterium sp. LB3P118]|uniref:TIGR02285 family protein n=1 Tax=Janthinobacterium sp. LB3P118 TaxID=3424195 RepID=UPI003F52488D